MCFYDDFHGDIIDNPAMLFLLRMKFQAFVIMLIAFSGLLFLLYVKVSMADCA